MNKLILFGFAFLLFPLNSVFGSIQTNLGDDIFVFVQTTVRNSDGNLVVYLESTKFSNLNISELNLFLDREAANGDDPIITIDDKHYQIIRRMQTQPINSDGLVASTLLFFSVDGKPILLARFAHDGYPIVQGDTLQSIWTFVRPVS